MADLWDTHEGQTLGGSHHADATAPPSPCRLDLTPEAQSFVDVELALSRQSRENVLLQPDDLRSVPAVGGLLSGDDTASRLD